MFTVLSAHALGLDSKNFALNILETERSQCQFSSLIELKQSLGFKGMLNYFSEANRTEIVLFEDSENFNFLKSILYVLLLVTGNKRVKKIKNGQLSDIRLNDYIRAFYDLISKLVLNVFLILRTIILTTSGSAKLKKTTRDIRNIVYVKTNLWFGIKAGGSLGHISGVVNSLVKKFNVDYVTCELPIMISDKVNIKKVTDFENVKYSLPYEINQLQNSLYFEKFLFQQSSQYDIIYQRLTLYNFSGARYANKKRIPFILEYNGSEVWIQNKWSNGLKFSWLAQRVEDYCIRSADIIVTVSEVLQNELVSKGVPKEKVVMYPNCIEPSIYNPQILSNEEKIKLRESLGFNESQKILTFVGTFGVWHGVEFMAHSIVDFVKSRYRTNGDLNFSFLLIGDGVLFSKVKEILNDDFVMRHVKLMGVIAQSETPKYLAISDVFLSPHVKRDGEAFFGSPTKLFEYMSFGKPIIASSLYQIAEIFHAPIHFQNPCESTHGDNDSLLFTPNSQEEFIAAMEFAIDEQNEQKMSSIGENVSKLVLDNYTWDIHVGKILEKI